MQMEFDENIEALHDEMPRILTEADFADDNDDEDISSPGVHDFIGSAPLESDDFFSGMTNDEL